MKLLVATRSSHKLREIRKILSSVEGLHLLDPNDVGITPTLEEDGIEVFESFVENAAAKARYFRARSGLPTVADDSGLCVDLLAGGPGVHSKRFAPGDSTGEARDRANNEYLLQLLGAAELGTRTARYVCAAVLDSGDGAPLPFEGRAEGLILGRPRGNGGFGYDPLFFDPFTGRTFAELEPAEKDARSHRGAAFRALARHLSERTTSSR